ncbi:hypothetical protein MESS2_870005 [Mesorhizobium metallidurans STM 2683]|uniref:CSD domain-containing protein n=1 Tax=Mesorhizobium metallidurans STM 2683 TaxID=1297569 RepID=M5EY83_9HYPH|nr:hypothetical protein MESS2_870005 [Mesorhizobium metallidurans STM 2683]
MSCGTVFRAKLLLAFVDRNRAPCRREVIWFNTSKGFGFVKLPEGIEAYLHIRVLEAAGKARNRSSGCIA